MKKKLMTLALAAGLVWGCVTEAKAIEFKASGEWLMGFGGVESTFENNNNGGNDVFKAAQRVRLQLDAVASEHLSGTLQIEIGDTNWGNAGEGGALGADHIGVKVMSAYLDWYVPNTELQFRMGFFGAAMPNAAGGSAIFDEQVAGVVANYTFNDNVGLTAMWLRPFNDNFTGNAQGSMANVHDNVDLFGLAIPLSFDGLEITPWAAYGVIGRNALRDGNEGAAAALAGGLLPNNFAFSGETDAYATQFYAGLPVVISVLDPWNIEFDINYASVSGLHEVSILNREKNLNEDAGMNRSGWVFKALVEYQLDWGRPGLFAWYATGDDGNVDNGSERMPQITGTGNFTSFVQDGYGWGALGGSGLKTSYDGTWAVGLQLSEFSFAEDLSHTLRVTYIGGTNSTEMLEYFDNAADAKAWNAWYLTTDDSLVEINFDSVYSIYENLNAIFEVGYIINGFDGDAWTDDGRRPDGFKGANDAWKVNLIFEYSF